MSVLIGIPAYRVFRATVTEIFPGPDYAIGHPDVAAVCRAGGIPVLIPPFFEANQAKNYIERLDGLYLAGGEDVSPEFYPGEPESLSVKSDTYRDKAELALAQAAIETGKPLLAICRGVQLLNVSLSGTLIDDITTRIPGSIKHHPGENEPPDSSAHPILLQPGSRLANIFGKTELFTNSFHHQAVKTPGSRLVIAARAPDGIIEAVELPSHPFCVGVQWHPEEKVGNREEMACLFNAFLQACKSLP
jgi:putative glutamine amidotransferase